MSTVQYMLDTNVFNDLLDGKLSSSYLAGHHLMVTGVQRSELDACGEPRRSNLLCVFEMIDPTVALASSFAFGVEGAGFGQAMWNDGSGLFQSMMARLVELDVGSQKRKKEPDALRLNQIRDIIIAETAIKSGAILLTKDRNLRTVVLEFGGKAIDLTS